MGGHKGQNTRAKVWHANTDKTDSRIDVYAKRGDGLELADPEGFAVKDDSIAFLMNLLNGLY